MTKYDNAYTLIPAIGKNLRGDLPMTGEDRDVNSIISNSFTIQDAVRFHEERLHLSAFRGHQPFLKVHGDQGRTTASRMRYGPGGVEQGNSGAGSGKHEGGVVCCS